MRCQTAARHAATATKLSYNALMRMVDSHFQIAEKNYDKIAKLERTAPFLAELHLIVQFLPG